jgi:hypothetical protein
MLFHNKNDAMIFYNGPSLCHWNFALQEQSYRAYLNVVTLEANLTFISALCLRGHTLSFKQTFVNPTLTLP